MSANLRIFWFLLIGLFSYMEGFSAVIRISPGQSIQKAVDGASAGDTLRIASGVYQQSGIVIRKPLVLIGENHPVLDGQMKGNILIIAAERVTIQGFKIINTGKSNMDDSAAIKFFDSKNCVVKDNILENAFFGLHFSNSSGMTISGNQIHSNALREFEVGNGIHLWKCKDSFITNNKVSGHRDGIYLEFVTNTEAVENLVQKNMRYGLHFMFSHDNSYIRNTFKNNGAGVAVMYTKNVLMKENRFEENWGSSAYGILLKDISDSEIVGNIFLKNTIGIYMEGSSRIEFTGNTFQQNGWALKLMASCDQNTFKANNFTQNTFDMSSNGSVVLNTITENYWDKYEGYDLNKDLIGDVPYRPINLYSVIVEKIPAAVMLWRSFMVTLLDRMEKILPTMTPDQMIDQSPKMKPYDFG
ncbi:nitrous oxide reductase family maturation protein NosD [Algoriphagus aestuariicola]|jgi:nitrous oxidase accessory protein|uniref:Nitrous oxide reductase family maturation protein NosD n=1 Tax=Algoriphagus aestuariicola TaxID=1852016 RepID=A0ABS3BUD3_9BACT|nr:nitrous oxide reductase family maturation protein NosD [Algoriphagus aestuariicola]MBN7801876.1 nitrous oxide reductase family maturation protein NosD [Algoriphagus aestuariicola]